MPPEDFDLQHFFETSLDLMCIAGIDGVFKRVNPAWERTLGFEASELLSRPYLDFVHPDDQERTQAEAAKLSAGGNTVEFENRYRCSNGEYLWLAWRATPDLDLGLIYAAARDITGHKLAEESLERTRAKLERSNRDLAQFAYAASHDLKEPLRMITNYLQLLEKRIQGALNEETTGFLHHAVSGAKRMRSLIDDLLEFSRVDTRHDSFAATDLNKVIEQTLENLQLAIEESGAVVSFATLPTVRADGTQLCQLFQNLVGNAIKFRSSQPPEIHISAERRGGAWIFSVRDNGIGIEAKFHKQIFGIFQRLHAQHEYEGTGVGLAICKKIVERHEGRIWLTSEPGQGTEFHFSIPDKERRRKREE